MATYYIAGFVPEDEGGYSVYFPDLPMVNAEGDTLEEATEMAASALSDALVYMAANNQDIPQPGGMMESKRAVQQARLEDGLPYPVDDVVFQLVKSPVLDNTPVRINVSLPKGVLDEIDQKAKAAGLTRSGLLSEAAKAYSVHA